MNKVWPGLGKALTFSNVVSLVALFIALGGVSYAMVAIPKNSVGSAQIKRNSIGSSEIKPASISSSELSSGSVGSREMKSDGVASPQVKDGSLTLADFAANQIPAGPKGQPGAAGPAGPAGTASVVMRKGNVVNVLADGFATSSASCLAGEKATGGGVFNESQVKTTVITSSYPTPNGGSTAATLTGVAATGWKVWVANNGAITHDAQAYVMCVSP